MAVIAPGAPRLKRRVGFWLLTLYGVGVMIGAGVYVLIGQMAGAAGVWTPLAFLLAGLAAAATGASFAELSARFPEAGGEIAFTREAFGSKNLSLAVGVAAATVGVVAGAAILKGGVGYLQALIPWSESALFALLAALLGALAALGVAESLRAAALLTLIELIGLMIVAAAGFFGEPASVDAAAEAAAEAAPSLAGLFAAVFLAYFAYLGFEDMVNLAEETRDPRRTVPRAILAAFAITTLIYILVAAAALRAVDPQALAESKKPLALVFESATGRSSGFISAIAVAATLNGVLAQLVMSARVLFGLGRQAPAFSVLHETHPRFGTPVRATAIATAALILVGIYAPLGALASAAVLLLLCVFTMMNLALIQLKRRGPPPERAPDLPRWAPWFGFVCSASILLAGIWSRLG